jgi:hypothetical protein
MIKYRRECKKNQQEMAVFPTAGVKYFESLSDLKNRCGHHAPGQGDGSELSVFISGPVF